MTNQRCAACGADLHYLCLRKNELSARVLSAGFGSKHSLRFYRIGYRTLAVSLCGRAGATGWSNADRHLAREAAAPIPSIAKQQTVGPDPVIELKTTSGSRRDLPGNGTCWLSGAESKLIRHMTRSIVYRRG